MARRGSHSEVAEVLANSTMRGPSVYLLDVNVLIALIDPMHSHHERAHAWFGSKPKMAWATCPITQNGVLRSVGHARYPHGPGSPVQVASLLTSFCANKEHQFWPDDLSLLDPGSANAVRLLSSGQVTDSYLLALAVKHHGKLATFDKRLVVDAVVGGNKALHVVV